MYRITARALRYNFYRSSAAIVLSAQREHVLSKRNTHFRFLGAILSHIKGHVSSRKVHSSNNVHILCTSYISFA